MTVLHVGLGAIGTPIALNFRAAGHDVVAVDPYVKDEARVELEAAGVTFVDSLAAALSGGGPEVLVSVLPDSDVVEAVARELMVVAPSSLLWIDMTSAQPDRTVELAGRLADAGIEFVDAPICSGGVPGARNASITVCVGGTDEQFGRAEPILAATAGRVIHVGPTGSGHTIKLLSNYVALGTVALMAEVSAVAASQNLDGDGLWETLSHCAAAGFVNLDQVHRVTQPTHDKPVNFRLQLARKDMRYLVAFAAACGVSLPMGEGAHALYLTAERQGRHAQEAVQAVMQAQQTT